jgi:hypothetical protein
MHDNALVRIRIPAGDRHPVRAASWHQCLIVRLHCRGSNCFAPKKTSNSVTSHAVDSFAVSHDPCRTRRRALVGFLSLASFCLECKCLSGDKSPPPRKFKRVSSICVPFFGHWRKPVSSRDCNGRRDNEGVGNFIREACYRLPFLAVLCPHECRLAAPRDDGGHPA